MNFLKIRSLNVDVGRRYKILCDYVTKFDIF